MFMMSNKTVIHMENKDLYETPAIELVEVKAEDAIAFSGGVYGGFDNDGGVEDFDW